VNPSIVEAFEPLFTPNPAIIGASAEPAKFGNIILRAINGDGYGGKIYPVNRKWGDSMG